MKPLKVAIISGEIPAPTFVERLVSGLASKGVHVFLFGKKHSAFRRRENVFPVGVSKKYEKYERILFSWKYAFLLRLKRPKEYKQLRSMRTKLNYESFALIWYRPDIVHVQWTKAAPHYQWVQDFGIKLIVSFRGAQINYSPISNKELAERYRQIFPKCDGFHAVSHAISEVAAQYGASLDKCKVVYSGFELSNFPEPSEKRQAPGDSLNIVSVGRAHWKKGYHYALDAIKLLKDRGISLNYHIVGVGVNEELMFQIADLGLSDCVIFGKKAPFDKVLEIIKEADVLLLPSVEEGIANVVIEAMLVGTPVITTNCGGMEELVTDGLTGIMTPVRDPLAIADAIERLTHLNLNQLNEMRIAAYNKAKNQHNQEQMLSGMLQLYNMVMDNDKNE